MSVQYRLVHRLPARIVLLALAAMTVAVPVFGQDQAELERLNRQGYELLESFDPARGQVDERAFREAVLLFLAGKDKAKDDKRWVARFDFAIGLSLQRDGDWRQAVKSEPPTWWEDLLEQFDPKTRREETPARRAFLAAVRFYREVVTVFPDSAATWNNLGQVYSRLGLSARAKDSFEKAVKSADPKQQAVFQLNYADFLSENEEWRSAAREYAGPALQQPQNRASHERAVSAFILAGDGEGLAGYLWSSVRAGLVLRAQQGVIEALQSDVDWGDDFSGELMSILVVALSYEAYSPGEFGDTEVGKILAAFAGQPGEVGVCAEQIVALHDPEKLQPRRFQWWANRAGRRPPPRGVWPRDAFRKLIRSLGARARQEKNYPLAETYYELALHLTSREVDPVSLRGLVDLYMELNQIQKIGELADRYQEALVEGKGQAYRDSQLSQIFEYHRTLGELYAYLDRWGDRATVTSALFQLDRARSIGARLDENPDPTEQIYQGASRPQLHFTPDLAELLAKGYEKTGHPEAASTVRLEYAEKLLKIGQTARIESLIGKIEPSHLAADQKLRLDRIKAETRKPF